MTVSLPDWAKGTLYCVSNWTAMKKPWSIGVFFCVYSTLSFPMDLSCECSYHDGERHLPDSTCVKTIEDAQRWVERGCTDDTGLISTDKRTITTCSLSFFFHSFAAALVASSCAPSALWMGMCCLSPPMQFSESMSFPLYPCFVDNTPNFLLVTLYTAIASPQHRQSIQCDPANSSSPVKTNLTLQCSDSSAGC